MTARIPVPGFPAVAIDAQKHLQRDAETRKYVELPSAYVHYIGSPEELVRLGLVAEGGLDVRPRKGKRSPRLDTRGNRFWINRSFAMRDGMPIGIRIHLHFDLELERALALPGVREAIAAHEAEEREEEAIARVDGEPQSSSEADETHEQLYPQSVSDWRSRVRGFCERSLRVNIAALDGLSMPERRFYLDAESQARIRARTAEYLVELLREIDRARVIDSQHPRARRQNLSLVVDNTRRPS